MQRGMVRQHEQIDLSCNAGLLPEQLQRCGAFQMQLSVQGKHVGGDACRRSWRRGSMTQGNCRAGRADTLKDYASTQLHTATHIQLVSGMADLELLAP